ncbi:Leucine-rich repeat domain superfamily [Sesbania bispinosa]|nr:Leucine-rich repeat domain superfamily [Sesbania bispinosa]
MADPKTQTKDSESPPEKRIRRALPNHHNHQQSPSVNLPDDVLENIFSFLPLKDAIVVGCNVSTKFKSSWRINRQFVFGKDFALRYTREDLITLVDRLFDSHRGTDIQNFNLHVDPIGIENLILKWLSICIQKNVEHLEFHFFRHGFILDSDFVSKLKKLSTLKLVRCEIQLPPLFSGLRFLQTLILWQMEMTEEKLECLVMNCKLLVNLDLFNCSRIRLMNIHARHHLHFKTLKIASCRDLFGIEIDAPTLKSLFYAGHMPRIRFGHGVTLDEAFLNFTPTRTYMLASEVEFLTNDLHHVRVLTTSALFIEALSARIRDGWLYREAQFCLLHLRELQLFMEGGSYCNPYDIVMFLKNCPSLESLFIDVSNY